LKKFPQTETYDYSGQTAGLSTADKMDVMGILTVEWEPKSTKSRCENINARVMKKLSWMILVTVVTI
jgi:hypothetical protein